MANEPNMAAATITKRRRPVLKALMWVAVVLVAFIVGFSIVVAMQPSHFEVKRTATIAAPPAVVFDHVNDFHNWEAWSPWAKMDPAAKNTFEGPRAGEGAVFKWAGNNAVGEGQMTIVESKPLERVKIKLHFIKPMEGDSDTLFTFEPAKDGGTLVTWNMQGENGFVGKAFCMFMNMDTMVGGEFDKGLASMKAISEATAPAAATMPARP